jgi:hypothetical protein
MKSTCQKRYPKNELILPILGNGFSTSRIGIVLFDTYEMVLTLVMLRIEMTSLQHLTEVTRLITDTLRVGAQENTGRDQIVRGFI